MFLVVFVYSRFDITAASPLSQSEVQAMLQSTRKQIEERRQQTQALVMVSAAVSLHVHMNPI